MHRKTVFPTAARLAAVSALLALSAACAREPDEDSALADDAVAPPAATTTPAEPAAGAVTDPQIAAIVVAANEVDVAAGELAREKAQDPQVKAFAETMVSDHNGVNQQASELVGRLGVTPEDNATAQQLRQGGDENLANLRNLSGAEFDRAYIAHEVEYHQAVLDAIDNTLVPSAQNAELEALLVKVRPAIESHLNRAREIQSSLGGA